MNIADILASHARDRPDFPAIEDGARIIAYGALDAAVTDAASNLQAAGIEPGDIVAVLQPDSADHLITLYALARAGAVIFSLNISLADDALKKSLANLPVKALITYSRDFPKIPIPCLAVQDICRPAPQPFDAPDISGDDPVMVIQSSGTTGKPKTIIRGHAETVEWINRYAKNSGWTDTERCLSITAMFFNTGRHIALGILRTGATVVINRAVTLEDVIQSLRDKRITYFKVTPVYLLPMLDLPGEAPLFPNMRAMAVGSAAITDEIRRTARARLTPNFTEQLGINEVGLVALATPADQDAYPDSVGRVIEGIEAQIIDPDGKKLPVGEVGALRLRGAGFPTQYLDDPETSARAFRDGWFYPGDLATLNDQGHLFLKGRADDVINNGGSKFYPMEIEKILMEHPDIVEAVVFGWPHEKFGEIAATCVLTSSTAAELNLGRFCANRMERFKIPKLILPVKEMPRNPYGKILKAEIKEIFRQKFEKSAEER